MIMDQNISECCVHCQGDKSEQNEKKLRWIPRWRFLMTGGREGGNEGGGKVRVSGQDVTYLTNCNSTHTASAGSESAPEGLEDL